jgi:RNA polymerase sigma-70 factor (ECF subfamily)
LLTTSNSLLDRLRNGGDAQAWQRWLTVYEPWLRAWVWRLCRPQPADGDDVLQEVIAVVHEKLPTFVHNGRTGAFRAWLRAILVNKARHFLERCRRGEPLPEALDRLEDPASDLSRLWDREHDEQLVRRLLALARPRAQPRTWEVFRLLVLEDRPATEVARHFGMELGAVYVAKSRVLALLRQEMAGLVGE